MTVTHDATRELTGRGAVELLAGLAAGEFSSEELVRAHLDRIARLNPALNALVARDPESSLAAAREADHRRARGANPGPLAGLPMTIKDSLEVAGFPAVCGAPALRDHRPARDALAVARLRAAGAIFLGKTNVPLYASDFQTFNEVFGATGNPWALDRTPGGSSGGAAAALAAGFTPLELGTDLAGSLRIPAHACGVASLKPSYGLVPLEGSLSGPPGQRRRGDLWVVGPMARRVADLELALDLIVGPGDPEAAAWRLDLPGPRPGQGSGGAPARVPRIALWVAEAFCPPDPAVVQALEAVAAGLESAGLARVERARPDVSAEAHFLIHCDLMYAEMAGGLPPEVQDYFVRRAAQHGRPAGLEPVTDLMAAGLALSHRDWLHRKEAQAALQATWARFFGEFDGLLCPAAPTVAPCQDTRRLDRRTQPLGGRDAPALLHSFWASLASTAGLPAATVPAGLDARGLPVGAQLIGPVFGDRRVLALAGLVEQVTGGFQPPPLVDGTFRASVDAGA